MRTRGQVDGVLTYAETLYQTVPSTTEGVEAFRAASARGGSTMLENLDNGKSGVGGNRVYYPAV